MKITKTLILSGTVALALGLASLAFAQSPPASTATPPATMAQPTTPATHKAATPSRPTVTASKTEIRQAQQALTELGYNVSVDGIMGTTTRNALKKFQKVNGIPRTGRLDTDTKRGLGLIGGQPPAGLNLGGYTRATVTITTPAAAPSTAMPMSTSGTPQQQRMRAKQQAMRAEQQAMKARQKAMQTQQQIPTNAPPPATY